MKRRLLVAVALVVAALIVSPAGAGAQYQTSCGFILDPPAIPTGGVVTILGSQFEPGSTVTFYISDPATGARQVLGTVVADADADGNLSATFPLPAGFDQDGEYLIEAQCPDGAIASNVLIVGAGTTGATATTSTLPATGSNSLGLARISLALLAVGGLLLLVSRRRAHEKVPLRS